MKSNIKKRLIVFRYQNDSVQINLLALLDCLEVQTDFFLSKGTTNIQCLPASKEQTHGKQSKTAETQN